MRTVGFVKVFVLISLICVLFGDWGKVIAIALLPFKVMLGLINRLGISTTNMIFS